MLSIGMWGQALYRMPRVNAEQWQALDPVAKWLIATRASILFTTLTSAILGGLLAWRDGLFAWQPWLAATLGLIFAHATNNLINDLSDSRRGIDKNNHYRNQYGVHVLEDGLMNTRQFWTYLCTTGGIALLLGAWLVWDRSGLTFNLMLAGIFFVLFYTWPLKYYGLGEPAMLLIWGPLMVGGTYYVVAGQWSWEVCWLSLIFGMSTTAVLFGKHIDKLDHDKAKGVNSMPVILGESMARKATIGLILAQYALVVVFVVNGNYGWPLLLVFLNLPILRQTIGPFRHPGPDKKPSRFPANIWPLWFSAFAFRHARTFVGLFLLGVVIDTLLK